MSKRAVPSQVPVFILAGGFGTRISEESQFRPKPMIEIGGDPILLHIMRSYYRFGFNDFVILAGYRSWDIKQYFMTYGFRKANLEIDHRTDVNSPAAVFGADADQENWRVRVIDTGTESLTGSRIARGLDLLKDESFEQFAVTYGDGVSDVELDKQLDEHLQSGKIGTVLGVHPGARFGELSIGGNNSVSDFSEKPKNQSDWINGGFFFFNRKFREYLSSDSDCVLEKAPLRDLARLGQLTMYQHTGFWHSMDTLRDKNLLEALVQENKAPWMASGQNA